MPIVPLLFALILLASPPRATGAAPDFEWQPELAPAGPVVIVVSLREQRASVYRNGVRIARTAISSGREGHETPPGVYAILQKRREHYSNLYDDAPMPFMQRLTWDGIALHGGRVTGAPASHGCIRLPEEFARRLFAITERGMTVIVSDGATPLPMPADEAILAPVEGAGAQPRPRRHSPPQQYHLSPELADGGPISVLVSSADAVVVVLRGGTEIARARIELDPGVRFGLHAWQMLEREAGPPSARLPGRREHRWLEIPLPAHDPPGHRPIDAATARAFRLPPAFASALHDWLHPGATVIVTDEAIVAATPVTVLDADAPRDD